MKNKFQWLCYYLFHWFFNKYVFILFQHSITHETIYVDLEGKETERFLASFNPLGSLPAVLDGDIVVFGG